MSGQSAQNSTFVTPGNGISGGYDGNNINIKRAMMSFTAIAWYNSIEIIVLVFIVFKRYSGAYFWSLLITALSIIIYAFGSWGKLVSISPYNWLPVSFTTWGWVVMVTGQSIVLWSRLHLITQNEKLLKGVLWMIIINTFVMCTPTVVLTYGSNTTEMQHYIPGYQVMERLQMTAFSVQELAISFIYLWEVRKLLKVLHEPPARNMMWQLAAINVAIIVLDIALLSVEFIDLYQIEITLKGMVYSIKLKLEFGVLSKLVKIITKKHGSEIIASEESRGELDVGLGKLAPVYTRDTNASLATATTLRPTDSYTYSSKRSASMSTDGRLMSAGSVHGFTAKEILQNDFATIPSVTEDLEAQSLTRVHSARSSVSDFYPGRLSP